MNCSSSLYVLYLLPYCLRRLLSAEIVFVIFVFTEPYGNSVCISFNELQVKTTLSERTLETRLNTLVQIVTFVVLIVRERSEPGKPSFQKFLTQELHQLWQLMYILSKREFSFLKEVIWVPRIGWRFISYFKYSLPTGKYANRRIPLLL